MKRLRDLIVLLVATVVFGYSLIMTRRAVDLTSPWFVLIAMFSFLGWVTFARPLFMIKMPRWLRPVRSWEVRGRFYRAIGVPGFGELLRRTPLRYLQPLVY